jgi:hypothetical protein
MKDKTADSEVFVIECDKNSLTYERSDGHVWKVTGKCDKRGLCMLGAVVLSPYGEEVLIEHVEQLNRLAREWNREGHIQTDEDLDVPISYNYNQSCCPFEIEILK